MNKTTFILFLLLFFTLSACTITSKTENDYNLDDLELVWSDEFDGTQVNLANWQFEIGGHGWGNNELEFYTDRPENAFIEDGNLLIQALEEQYQGSDYTSARLITLGRQEFQYGRIEARIDLPTGKGIWPAFWMLGNDINTVSWPTCGEIDIMEHLGNELQTVHGTLHGPGYYGGGGIGTSYRLEEENFADGFHIFAIEWVPGQIQWFVDGNLYHTVTKDMIPENTEWVFDHPFFIILNLAVGGNWPGSPDSSTQFPQQMLVDYVRVYQADSYEGMANSAEKMIEAGIEVKMKIKSIDLKQDKKDRVTASVLIEDQFGNPVKGVELDLVWSGSAVDKKEVTQKTDNNGMVGPINSPKFEQDGKVFLCVEKLVKEGYVYDFANSASDCSSIEIKK
jgi:beta-glucanase (GH16 family)